MQSTNQIAKKFFRIDPEAREYNYTCHGIKGDGARCTNRATTELSNGTFACHIKSHQAACADGRCAGEVVRHDTGEVLGVVMTSPIPGGVDVSVPEIPPAFESDVVIESKPIRKKESKMAKKVSVSKSPVIEIEFGSVVPSAVVKANDGEGLKPVAMDINDLRKLAAEAYRTHHLVHIAYRTGGGEQERQSKSGRKYTIKFDESVRTTYLRPTDVFEYTTRDGETHAYLKGRDLSVKDTRTYRLDKILSIEISDRAFTPAPVVKIKANGKPTDAVVADDKVLLFPTVDGDGCRARFKAPQAVALATAGKYLASGQWALMPNLHNGAK